MIEKAYVNVGGSVVARVTFTLPESIWADSIFLVGDFNDWNRSSHPLKQDNNGRWTITVDLERGRSYQFRYLADGEWMNDNAADAFVANRYGSHNFVVVTDSAPQNILTSPESD